MTAALRQLGGLPSRIAGGARNDRWLEPIVIILAAALAGFSLREYLNAAGQYIAAPDYQAEILPALAGLSKDGIRGFLDHLPGYPGAVMVELVPAQISQWLGLDEATTWRVLSAFGVSILALAILSAVPLIRATEASRGAARTALAIAVASPASYWALRIGHPEEVMSTGLLVGAVFAAARERPVIAGLLLGLAVGKAWPAVAALPVLALLLPDPVRVLKGIGAAAFAAALIYVPPFLYAHESVNTLSSLGTAGIFNVGQIFWWFGTPIPLANVAVQVVPQPRVAPTWPGELSHPLILGVGTAIGGVWAWTLWQRLVKAAGSIAALRADGRTRSREQAARLAGGACLVMAGILYARCYLDTWNVPYYLLPGLVLGALGEVLLGRRPIITLVATGLMWKWHSPGDLTVRSSPDIYTALYLAWTIPFSIAFFTLGFKALRDPADEPGPAPAVEPSKAAATASEAAPAT